MRHDVLIINSYAGSLTIAAHQEKREVRGSFEDAGYGLEIQRANFPKLRYVERLSGWPNEDLSRTVVLAHPPCAAFSQQNNSASKRGTDAAKFQCTKAVLDYAMRNHCAALAVESVCPALEGARAVHDEFAAQYGYVVFRILQNAITFGCPQWRPRFWAVFLPKEVEYFSVHHDVRMKSIGETMIEAEPGPVLPYIQSKFDRMMAKFRRLKFTEELIDSLINPQEEGEDGILAAVIQRKLGLDSLELKQVAHDYLVGGNPKNDYESGFQTNWTRSLLPTKWATTLLYDSNWVALGRPLSISEYNAVMGFPRDYQFPGKWRDAQREFLSRGVCPPVAKFILKSITDNIEAWPEGQEATHTCQPGDVLDLNIKKGDFLPKKKIRI